MGGWVPLQNRYRQVLYFSANAKFSSLRRRFMHLRPLASVSEAPGVWWRFAARVVLRERWLHARAIVGEREYQVRARV